MNTRALSQLLVSPGPTGVQALLAALPSALSGEGAAIAPAEVGVPEQVRTAWNTAVRADDRKAPLESDAAAVVLTTSGSTGTPIGVLLSAAALRAAADSAHDRLAGPGHWLVALPVTSVGGLMTIVRALVSETRPVIWPGVGGAETFTPESFLASAELTLAQAGTEPAYVSLVPTQLQRIVSSGGPALAALARFSAVLVGAADLPSQTRNPAVAAGVNVVRTYGMTETCGGFCYEGRPLGNMGLEIVEEDTHGVGRVVVSGSALALGYRLQPDLPATRFTSTGLWTEDLGRLVDGRLTIVGRLDEMVKVGGVSVALPAVAAVLRAHVGISDAVAVARPDPEWGVRVVAVVVTSNSDVEGVEDLLPQLQRVVGDRLGRLAAPVAVRVVPEIPLLPNGKPDRVALAALVER